LLLLLLQHVAKQVMDVNAAGSIRRGMEAASEERHRGG